MEFFKIRRDIPFMENALVFNVISLVTFVAAGLGLAVVPEPTSDLAVPGVVYVPLVGSAGVDLLAATRAGDENPVLARALAMLADLAR